MTSRYNLVVLGKSGVGKSTLVNYLFGAQVAKTGVGRPVTEKGFHAHNFELNGLPVTFFDSWGLEANKAEEWLENLTEELKSRGEDRPATEWFHSIIYCVSAGGARIEDFEITIINRMIYLNYRVMILLTKADQATNDECEILTSVILRQLHKKISVFPVSAEFKTMMGGRVVHPFGKDEIYSGISSDLWESIVSRLPKRIEYLLLEEVNCWKSDMMSHVEAKITWDNLEEQKSEIKLKTDIFVENLEKKVVNAIIVSEFKSTMGVFLGISTGLGILKLGSWCNIAELPFENSEKEDLEWWEWGLSLITVGIYALFRHVSKESDYNKQQINMWISEVYSSLEQKVQKLTPKIAKELRSLGKKSNKYKLNG